MCISLETEDKIVAGKDFEPGVYDVSIPEWNGWGVLYLKVKTTDPYDEDGYYETSICWDGGESGKTLPQTLLIRRCGDLYRGRSGRICAEREDRGY